jgi:lysozyme
MKYSKQGADLTKMFEQCRLTAYWDGLGKVWTIGWGHTRGVSEGVTCSQQQADDWLMEDISSSERNVNAHVKIEINQHEFDALVDFDFNLGDGALNGSTLLRLLNAGDFSAAAKEFEKWDHAAGKVVAGLLRRRLAEEKEFQS